ncbi:Low-specificity L-threonine aldolase [Cyberlindnera fabianii]|uniref:low-specificity L-threonine aldolase n=1 Tax=Cyberlindnera fabianii TaxID=36022 RepID=A0A1V2L019_CYBFA|nr:Low-specificity L-threonine aldolase [Cyberlindnera fabianii]
MTASSYKPAHNEFRSDTFTTPSQAMLESVFSCSVGDSVYNEDDDTKLLESRIADMCGKEAGLYCVSGTMTNQVGIRTHLKDPPYSIVCDYRSHVYQKEAAGLAMLSNAMVYPAYPSNGAYLTLEDIKKAVLIDDGDIHGAPTRLISLENTISGVVIPIEELKRIRSYCDDHGLILHCDGARLWNASIASGVSFKEYGELFDSISICLSKGLGAPIGSVLVGSSAFIKKANHWRKQLGGGTRQSGILARMAMVAIDENLPLIKSSHDKARNLADYLTSKGIKLLVPCDTNFVFLDFDKSPCDLKALLDAGKRYNVKLRGARIAFHYQISDKSLENCKKAIMEAYEASDKIEEKTLGGTY